MRHTVTGVWKMPPIVALIAGAVLAALEAVQINISMSTQAHDAITLVISLLSGLGILAVKSSAIVAVIPHQALVAITAVLGTLNVVQTTSFHVSPAVHSIIAVVIVVGNTLFTVGLPKLGPTKVS